MEMTVTFRWEDEAERREAAAVLRRMADALDGAAPAPSGGTSGPPRARASTAAFTLDEPTVTAVVTGFSDSDPAWTTTDVGDLLLGCPEPDAAALVLLQLTSWQRSGEGLSEAELCQRTYLDEAELYDVLAAIGRRHSQRFSDRPELATTWTRGDERFWSMDPATAQTVLLALLSFQESRAGADGPLGEF